MNLKRYHRAVDATCHSRLARLYSAQPQTDPGCGKPESMSATRSPNGARWSSGAVIGMLSGGSECSVFPAPVQRVVRSGL